MNLDVIFKPKSILGALTVISFLGAMIDNGLATFVFAICFSIWLIFVIMSIARNLGYKF